MPAWTKKRTSFRFIKIRGKSGREKKRNAQKKPRKTGNKNITEEIKTSFPPNNQQNVENSGREKIASVFPRFQHLVVEKENGCHILYEKIFKFFFRENAGRENSGPVHFCA